MAGKIMYSGQGCPRCAASKGEVMIRHMLMRFNVSFEEQYKFDNCRYKLPLLFDFAVFENNTLLFLIEYDGIQHFEPTRFSNSQDAFDKTKIRDEIKNEYCKKNNIPLLRIPYWQKESDIEDMIQNTLRDISLNNNKTIDAAVLAS